MTQYVAVVVSHQSGAESARAVSHYFSCTVSDRASRLRESQKKTNKQRNKRARLLELQTFYSVLQMS